MKALFDMSIDIRLLVYSAFLCIVMWLPYVLTAIRTFGLRRMVGYPTPGYDQLPQ